jgi:hypothetical protein
MPLVALACPPSAPTFGEAHEFAYCISECKNRCLSPYMIAALAASNERNHHVGRYVSITSLSGCNRKLFLERTEDFAQEAKKVLYGYRGTVMHTVIEDAVSWQGLAGKSLHDLGYLTEWNMKVGFCFDHGAFSVPPDIDPDDIACLAQNGCPSCDALEIPRNEQIWFVLGGTLDGAEPLWKGGTYVVGEVKVDVPAFDPEEGTLYMVLHDLKTMKDYAVNKFIFGDKEATLHSHTKDEYYKQAQCYRYLAERSIPPDSLTSKGVKRIRFVEARIQAFSMGEFPYMGAGYMARKHYKHELTSWFIPSITFENDKWVEEYVRKEARDIFDTLITQKRVAPITEPSGRNEHSWKCDFCSFFKSEFCPNPAKEWAELQAGITQEDAYKGSITIK